MSEQKDKNRQVYFLTLSLIVLFSIFVNAMSAIAEPNPTVIIPRTFGLHAFPNEEINISVEVRQFNYSIDKVKTELTWPNGTAINYSMRLDTYFTDETGIGIAPYNATAPSFDISINCYDFTDSSGCRVNASNFYGACINISFDDALNGSQDLDIGVLLCVNETADSYNISFTRWGYDAGHEIGAEYCINPSFGVNSCSGWMLNSTASSYSEDYLKTPYGGIYRYNFLETQNSGFYNVTFFANDTNNNVNNTETALLEVYELINYTIELNKTSPAERPHNISLCGVIDGLGPETIDNLSQSKYDSLKNSTLYQMIVFFNNYIIDPNITAPLNYDINNTNISRFVIKINQTLDQNTYTFLKCHNIALFDRFGDSYFVKLNPNNITYLSNTSFIKGIWEIPLEGKLGTNLTDVNISRNYNVSIQIFDDVNCSVAEPILSPYITEEFKANHSFNETCSDIIHRVIAEINGSNINNTVKENIVKRLILDESNKHLSNYNAQLGTGSDIISGSYSGAGVRVAVVDTGIAYSGGSYHPDLPTPIWSAEYLLDRFNPYDEEGHGTHITGILMGRGNRNPFYKGVAPGAELVVLRMCTDHDNCRALSAWLANPIPDAISHDSNIISISYAGGNKVYGDDSILLDNAVMGAFDNSVGNPGYPTIVVAAGNDNDLVEEPATAKNVISVGAAKTGNHDHDTFNALGVCDQDTESAGEDACFSNYGPIDTGSGNRKKPDVIAPGYLVSTYPWYLGDCNVSGDNYYCRKVGTSMAAPVVSGIAASVLHNNPALKDWPEAVKAKIINSAVKLPTDTVPEIKQGHGYVNAFYSITNHPGIFETVLLRAEAITYGDPDKEYTFSVPSGFKEVKVTMVYTDDAVKTTEQDLDFRVYDANNNYKGSGLLSSDNVEEAVITSGVSGTWKVKISPYATTRQVFYSVVVSVRSKDPDLDMAVYKDISTLTASNTPFRIETYLKNYGYSTVGSYVELGVPSGFTLDYVDIYRSDGTHVSLDDSQLYYTGNYYKVSVGETTYAHDRVIFWHLKNNQGTSNGVYTFNIDYDAINHGKEWTSTQVTIDIHETNCADGTDNDNDGYTDCADGDCIQGSASQNGFCCGSGCSVNGGSCSDASKSDFTCVDGNCNTYSETCRNGELQSSLLCSGTSLSCSGGTCQQSFGAPPTCDGKTPGDNVCESGSSYNERACEVSGTDCYVEAEYACYAPSGCDEKAQNACSVNSGFQCEWQSSMNDNVVEECDSSCSAVSECDEENPGYNLNKCVGTSYYEDKCSSSCQYQDITSVFECTESGCSCAQPLCDGLTAGNDITTCSAGYSYFADKCTSTAGGEDRGDNTCRSANSLQSGDGCTADSQCNGVTAGTGDCDSDCNYISNLGVKLRDSTDTNVATLAYNGNIILKGACYATPPCNPTANSFIIHNATGGAVAYINETGDMCISVGTCTGGSATCNPSIDAFIVQNSTGKNVSYIDRTGDLCLIGTLTQNGSP
ncbi:MAG: S8 family serine peptidase [Nanoarchaeota archaeon]|nr:S8 family serine peptidase [Nanoarchaeota archaeon]